MDASFQTALGVESRKTPSPDDSGAPSIYVTNLTEVVVPPALPEASYPRFQLTMSSPPVLTIETLITVVVNGLFDPLASMLGGKAIEFETVWVIALSSTACANCDP